MLSDRSAMMGGFQSILRAQPGAGPPVAAKAARRPPSAWLRTALLLSLVAPGPGDAASPAREADPDARPLVVTAVSRLEQPLERSAAGIDEPRLDAPDARVSTSPDVIPTARSAIRPPTLQTSADDHLPPLTRAATRQRVESISPVPWLAQFGPVSLEQRE